MAEDFKIQLSSDLDVLGAEAKLNNFLKQERKIKIGVELEKSAEMQAKDLSKSIERGFKSTKIETGTLAKQVADSFNISDKSVVGRIKSQLDSMMSSVAKTWNGKAFDLSKATGFTDGIDKMAQTVSQNAKILERKTGIYDQFANYFKNKKIFVSDDLKSAMGDDLYKEISKANIGKIVRDSAKGISIDSIWEEMTDLFPEHFSKDVTNQVDQIVRAFDILKAARADVAKSINFADMSPDQQMKTQELSYDVSFSTIRNAIESLKNNITSASDTLKTEFEIDVKVNTDNIVSEIKNALSAVGTEEIKINIDIDKSEIESQIRNAIQGISANDSPLDIKIDINKQSLESDIQAVLHEIDLPVQFRVDASDIESQIRAAVATIDDIQIDVHVNTDNIRNEVMQGFDNNPVQIPVQADNNAFANITRAGQEGVDIFTAFGGTVREAFSAYTLANLFERGLDQVVDAGREAINIVKELDDAALQLQIASGKTRAEAKDMISDYRNLGNELGNLTQNVAESADAWIRQGKTVEETNTLIADSVKLSTVGQISNSDATEYLTSAMNGYKVAVNDVSKINDKLTSIDLVSATSAGSLAEAMSRTATSADLAGISMDRLLGMLATVGEITQKSMSSIGESFKTVFARMRNVKAGNLSSVGEDGLIEDISDVEIVLNSLGIRLRDSNQEFRNFQTVLDEVASGWNNYSSVQQAAIAKAFAGQRQQENFLVMMENYDRVLKYTSVAANSEGATDEKFGAYLDSLESQTNKLKNSLEQLATDTITDDMYEGFLEAATAASDFVRETDLVKTALVSLGTAGTTYAFTQLSTMLGNTLTQIHNLGGGIQGLWGVLSAHPVALVTAGVTAVIGAWNAYQKSVEEAVNSARQAGSAWEDSNTSIQDYISKIRELGTALDSGKLTEQEAYDAKAQLLDIQNQLSESYGDQVAGIDLVNGSIDEQIKKLKELSIAQADRFLNENEKGIEVAQKQMEKQRHTYLGQFSPYAQDADKLQSIIDEYKDKGIYTDTDMDGTVYIHFKGDATQANEVLNAFMTDVRTAADETGNVDFFDGFSKNASVGLNEAKDVLDEYQDLYYQAMKADIQTNKKDYGGKTAAEWLNNYSKTVENYKTAVSSGTVKDVEDARKNYNAISNSLGVLLNNTDMSQYSALFTDVFNQLDMVAIKANEFNSALNVDDKQYKYLNGYQKKLKGIADGIKNLNMSDVDFKAAVNTGDIDSINYLSQAAQYAGVSTDDLAQSLVNLGILSGQPTVAMEQTASTFDTVAQSANDLISQLNAVNSALSSQSTGKSIDLDTFNSDELADYRSALEYVNGTMQINTEKVKELQKAKAEEAIATNDATKAQLQSDYLQQIAQIEELRDKLRDKNFAEGETAESIQASIDSYLASNDAIAEQCSQLDLLNASLREATGTYQAWLEAQNTAESGDMFDDSLNAIQAIRNTADSGSDEFGKIGTKKYEAAVDFVVPDSIDKEDSGAVQSYLDSIEKYFNHDDKGGRTGLDLETFLNSAVRNGLMTVDESGTDFQLAGQMTMEKFAEGMNMSLPMVQAFFGELQEYGGKFDWSDEAVQTVGDLGLKANEAAESLRNIDGNQDFKINMDVSDIDTVEGQISALDETISEMNTIKAKPEVDASEVENANAVIQYCVAQKQLLNAPAVMNVDTSKVSGDIGKAISLLQQFQTAQNTVEMQANVGADTSNAQAEVDGLVSEIQGLSPEIKANLMIDDTSATTITSSLQGLSPEVMVKYGVNEEAILGYNPENKDATVKYDKDSSIPDGYKPSDKNATVVYGIDHKAVDGYNPINLQRTVTYTVKTNGSAPKDASGGGGGVNGTAHASGTAMVGGNWGAKQGGKVLVGELGREILVDPHTGKWREIGVNGAEFIDMPRGAIIFNHLQSNALLERGWVNGRGTTSFASGTAMVTGGINISHVKSGGSSSNAGSSSSNSGNTSTQKANTNATNNNTTAVKKSTKAFDWVERRLKYFADKTKAIADTITDYVTSAFKTAQLDKQMKSIDSEIAVNQKAYDAYMKKANSVALSAKYKKLVQEGHYYIGEGYSETVANAIDKYQEYYDKAMECKQAVTELKNEQLELFEQWANMPTEAAEKKIESYERRLRSITTAYDTVSTGGSSMAKYAAQIKSSSGKNAMDKAVAEKNTAKTNLDKAKAAKKVADSNVKTADKAVSTTASTLKSAAKKKSNKVSSSTQTSINNAIKNGKKVSTKGLSGDVLKAAKAYNASLDKQDKAEKAQSDAQKKVTSAQNTYNTAKKNATKATDNYNYNYKNALTSAQRAALKYVNDVTYKGQNALLDAQLTETKNTNTARQTALTQATNNLKKWSTERTSAINARDKAKKQLTSSGYANKNLTKAQKEALKNNQVISTAGIKNTNLLNWVKTYNAAVQKLTTTQQKYNIALNAQQEAAANAAEAQAEYAKMLVENEQQKFENIQNYYNAQIDYQKALEDSYSTDRERKEAYGKDTTESDFQKQIDAINKQKASMTEEKKKLETQLNNSVKKGIIKANSEEWYKMKADILALGDEIDNLDMSVLELQDTMREEVFYRAFEKALEKADSLRSTLSDINRLITDEMKYDDNGKLTDFGLTALAMDVKNYESYLESIQTLLNKRAEYIKQYNGGNNSTNYSQKKFDDDMQKITEDIRSLMSNADDARRSVISAVTSQAKAELDAINKVIDAEKERWKKRKEYNDYDKTLRDKTKEIQLLKQQSAALEGVTDAESRAQKVRIDAQIAEKENDLQDTVQKHVYDITVEGLDELSEQLQDNYDNWSKELNSNLEKLTDTVSDVKDTVDASANTLNNAINEILKSFGISGLTLDTTGIPKFASGTKHVSKSGLSLTQEKGREIVFKDGSVLLPLEVGDAVMPNELTERMFNLAENYEQIVARQIPTFAVPDFNTIVDRGAAGTVVSNHYDSLITVEGNVDKNVVGDLKELTKNLLGDRNFMHATYKYTSNEIAKDLRKSR